MKSRRIAPWSSAGRHFMFAVACALAIVQHPVPADAAVSIPVVACSFRSMAGQVSVHAPRTINANVPPQFSSMIAFYTIGSDGAGRTMGVYAPRGWHCAGRGGTGGSTLYVVPEESQLLSADQEVYAPVVTLQNIAGYGGHHIAVLQIGAPLFSNIRAIARMEMHDPSKADLLQGVSISLSPHAGERVTHLTPTTLTFCDPPGIQGAGSGSGGQYESCGFVEEQYSLISPDQYVPDLRMVAVTIAGSDTALERALVDLNR